MNIKKKYNIEVKFHHICMIVTLLGICFRIVHLIYRPIHHDESLHLTYSLYQFDHFFSNAYKYNPMLHGPFQYYFNSLFMILSKNSYIILRIPYFLISIFIMLAPLLIKKLTINIKWGLVGIFAISPQIIYWSTFIRNDFFVLLIFAISLILILNKSPKRYFIIPLIAITSFTIKENAYLHLALLIGYLLTYLTFKKEDILINKKHKNQIFFGILSGLIIYTLLYTNFFTYPQGFIDGLYKKSISYWANQHRISRLNAPFIYHLYLLFIYNPLILLISGHLFLFAPARNLKLLKVSLININIGIILYFCVKFFITPPPILSLYLKTLIPIDYFAFYILLSQTLILTIYFLYSNKKLLSFIFYSVGSITFSYSFIGEKVPWLSLYIVITLIIFIVYTLRDYFDRPLFQIITIFYFIFLSYINIKIIYNHNLNKELIKQVYTDQHFEEIIQKINKSNKSILVQGESIWPSHYFLNKHIGYSHQKRSRAQSQFFDYIITDIDDFDIELKTQKTHQRSFYNLRNWWVPNWNKLSIDKSLKMLFLRRSNTRLGHTKISIYKKRVK